MTDTDADLRAELKELDVSEHVTVESYEADFIENVVYKQISPLSEKQRKMAQRLIDKYMA